jgi:geranylgeranyl diphosphate synthase type 3
VGIRVQLCSAPPFQVSFPVKVAHKIYGVPQTINTANYVYFLAFQEILALKAQGHTSDDAQKRLYAESDMDQIVTSRRTRLHPWKWD